MTANGNDIAIIGAGGFSGRELLNLLRDHPACRPVHITSNLYAGTHIAEVFPDLDGVYDVTFSRHDDPLPPGCTVFLAVPNDTALETVPKLLDAGHRVIDLSGAFRLHDRTIWEKYYKLEHTAFHLMEEAVFGMPELFREQISGARLIANPGCYSTAAILPLYLLGEARTQLRSVIIDAKSGVSGAGGRSEDGGFVFHKVHENFRAYKILGHQHQPEIEEYAATHWDGRSTLPVVFTPHLLPLYRGILATIVLVWEDSAPADLEDRIRGACEQEPFLRFRNTPEEIELSRVQHTNYLDVALRSDGNTTVMLTALDNLVKGAAGQAVQNLNLMLGQPETAGLLPGVSAVRT